MALVSNARARSKRGKDVDVDVVIVGLGPVGGTLAALLGLCGISVLVLERESAIYHLPRAVHFDDEVMRVFQTIGIAEEVEAKTLSNLGMKFVGPDGTLLLDWPRRQVLGEQGWQASYRFHQPDLERTLRASLSNHASVETRERSEVKTLADNGTSVDVRYEDLARGKSHDIRAALVVGCDGARSLVRRVIGSEMDDYGFRERWLVIDVLLKVEKPELGDPTIQHCDPARPATYVRGPGNRRRWEITVHPEEDADEICKPSSVWGLLERWLNPEEAELERATVYTFHSVIAKRWRSGRLAIAGDAAHQTPPFMGQGMCAGIRDTANLAWKIALWLRGKAADDLLDTYQSERHSHTREYIETAIRLGNLINASDSEEALRAGLYRDDGATEMDSIVPRLGPGLSAGDTSYTGLLFSQPQLPNGKWMDDVIGYAPVVLADAELWDGSKIDRERFSSQGLTCITTENAPSVTERLSAMNVAAVALRPDRYILGTAKDAEGLQSLVSGSLPSPLSDH